MRNTDGTITYEFARRLIAQDLERLDAYELNEVFMYIRARAAFRSGRFAERDCDHCGRSYCGPSVYCSLRCATTDK